MTRPHPSSKTRLIGQEHTLFRPDSKTPGLRPRRGFGEKTGRGAAPHLPRCIGITTYRKSSRPTGRMTPGLEEVAVSSATLGVSITLSTSTRYLTLKAISTGPPSTVASNSATLWAASRAKMSEVLQALRNSAVDMTVRVVWLLGTTLL